MIKFQKYVIAHISMLSSRYYISYRMHMGMYILKYTFDNNTYII